MTGSTLPRIFTPPLVTGPPGPCGCGCALTEVTSYGFAVERFADETLGTPLDPWERWLIIHAGEVQADGWTPRFRSVLVLVARQNGKTHLLVVLTLFWMFVQAQAMILGISSKLEYAKEPWAKALAMARSSEWLLPDIGGTRKTNGEQEFWTVPTPEAPEGCRYKIAAATEDAGRSLTVNRLIMDEVRRQKNWVAYSAATHTQNAVRDAQAFFLSNQGPEDAVVLDGLRNSALTYLADPSLGDPTLGLFEWSMPYRPGGKYPDVTDPANLAQANPNLGRRVVWGALIGAARRAKANGGRELTDFLTEVGCVRVRRSDPAVDADQWDAGGDPAPFDAYLRARTACCLDVGMDGLHATLVAAALDPEDRVRVEVVRAWDGPGCTAALRRELPALIRRVRPRVLAWFPDGPAAAVAAELIASAKSKSGARRWPASCQVREIRADVRAACMGFAELVGSAQVLHPRDELLTTHVTGVERLWIGDAWRFVRKGAGHCDAAYAAAGAAHEARILPPPPPPIRLVRGTRR